MWLCMNLCEYKIRVSDIVMVLPFSLKNSSRFKIIVCGHLSRWIFSFQEASVNWSEKVKKKLFYNMTIRLVVVSNHIQLSF